MPAKSSGRNERVAAAIRREAAQLLQQEIKDPRLTGATVTEVEVSGDLRNARIFVSFLRDDEEFRARALEGLKSITGFMRAQLASRLKLRYIPELTLCLDTLVSDSMHLDALIQKGLNRE